MKVLGDIWSSIIANAKTRISDPLPGTFIVSWMVCNWNHLALLFWGDQTTTSRINEFQNFLSQTDILAFNSLLTIPALISLAYLLVLPWLSLGIKAIQEFANKELYEQTIKTEIKKTNLQEELNKAILKSDPNKQFLEQSLKFDIDRKQEILEQIKLRTIRFSKKAEEASAKFAEAESRASILQLEAASREKHLQLERLRFEANSLKARANLASHRFPSAYLFMTLLEDSLSEDEIWLSLSSIGKIIAVIFGYPDFKAIIEDEKFNNDTLSSVEYIYVDLDELAKNLEHIVSAEKEKNPELTSSQLHDHIQNIFEDLPYNLTTLEKLEEESITLCEYRKFELLNSGELSGPMAESDTIFDEIHIDGVDSSTFHKGFIANISAFANGHHRKDEDIPGQDLLISLTIQSHLILGEYALGPLQIENITGNLADYHEEEPDD